MQNVFIVKDPPSPYKNGSMDALLTTTEAGTAEHILEETE